MKLPFTMSPDLIARIDGILRSKWIEGNKNSYKRDCKLILGGYFVGENSDSMNKCLMEYVDTVEYLPFLMTVYSNHLRCLKNASIRYQLASFISVMHMHCDKKSVNIRDVLDITRIKYDFNCTTAYLNMKVNLVDVMQYDGSDYIYGKHCINSYQLANLHSPYLS